MSSGPDVSVVMSVYNCASQLGKTVESILTQKGIDLEFVIVNDGSSDKSSQILDWYAQEDRRIRIIQQENTGLTRALVRACEVARGEFIARQDAGDISLPGRLERQAATLRELEDCTFVSCWTDIVGPNGEYLYTSRGTGVASAPINILSRRAEWGVIDGPAHHSSVMFRSKQYMLCGGYRAEFYFGQDWDLWYRLSSYGTFYMLQQRLCICRVAPESISASNRVVQNRFAQLTREAFLAREAGLSDRDILDKARELSSVVIKLPTSRRERAAGNYFIGKCLLDNYNKAARSYLLETVKEYPLHFRGWVNLARSLIRTTS